MIEKRGKAKVPPFMSKVVLLPHGTAGDVLPYVFLGRRLVERGHQVTMIWIESFRAAAERAGLQYVTMDDGGFEEMLQNPAVWHPHKGLKLGFACAGRCLEPRLKAFFEDMDRNGAPDLLLAPRSNYAARLLREKLGVPFVSVVIYPMGFVSAYEVPAGILAAGLLRLLPVFVRKLIFATVSPYDRFVMPYVRESCLAHGVVPPRKLNREWGYPPEGVLALFPSWYGRPQPDWPKNCLQWDFPMEDLSMEKPLPAELSEFLDAGEKPVVFTLGTGNHHTLHFFTTALELCSRLGCRAVFLTRDPTQIPEGLPATVLAVKYAAFSALLPRARAFVHHGGIGTLALGCRAGLPQFVVHMACDQPDNGERLARMGVGVTLDVRRFNVKRALPLLRRCLEDESMRRKAEACARLSHEERMPESVLVDWLEDRMRKAGPAHLRV